MGWQRQLLGQPVFWKISSRSLRTLPSDVFTSYDFIWRNPKRLGPKTWVFLASFSGGTEDTVAALRHANTRTAHTIALVNKADSLMGREAKETIAYNSKALYILPLAIAYLFALEYASLQGAASEVEPIIKDLYNLPALLRRQFIEQKAARQLAEQFKDERIFYTLASGPLWGLGYKFGLTVFMENFRVHGSFMDATEFRHGPAEMLEREKPTVVVLMGTDESRPIVERVRHLCAAHNVCLLNSRHGGLPQRASAFSPLRIDDPAAMVCRLVRPAARDHHRSG